MVNQTILHRGDRYLVKEWAPNGTVAVEPPNADLVELLREVIKKDTPLLYRPIQGLYEVILPIYSLQPTTAKPVEKVRG
ncbi:MAG: hypothetical protein WCK15_02485 [Pirellula sp.]